MLKVFAEFNYLFVLILHFHPGGFLGSPILMDPHLSQQHAGHHEIAFQL